MNIFRLVGNHGKEVTRVLLAALLLALPLPAMAVLGDNAASVLTDQARMKGTLRSVDNGTYVMHEITSGAGTVVREFVSPAGVVFGVAWEGQFPPDLQQLLGPYYQQAQRAEQAGTQAPQPRSGRDQDPRSGAVRDWAHAEFPRTGLHSSTGATRCSGQRNPLRRRHRAIWFTPHRRREIPQVPSREQL